VYDRLLGTTMQARSDEVSRKLSLDSSVSVSLQRS
jgi:hypothetical protein